MTLREPCDSPSLRAVPQEIYVLARVSSIRSQPDVQFFPDPWRMLYDNALYHASNVELGLVES